MGARRPARPLCGDACRRRGGQRFRARGRDPGGGWADRCLGVARDDGAGGRAAARPRLARDWLGAIRRAAGAGAGHPDPTGDRRGGSADAGGGSGAAQRLGRGQGPVTDGEPASGLGGGNGGRHVVPGAGRGDAGAQRGRDAMVGAGGGFHAAGRGRAGAAVFFRDPAAATRRGRAENLGSGVGS